MQAPLIDRVIDVLAKVQFQEAIDLRRELEVQTKLNPFATNVAQLKLLVLKSAAKNTAEAVKALEALDLTDEAMEFFSILNAEVVKARDEVNE